MLQTQWPGKGEETAEQSKTSSLKAEIETVSVSQSSSKLITVTVKQLLYKQPIPLYTMEGFDREIKCNGNEGTSVYTPVLFTISTFQNSTKQLIEFFHNLFSQQSLRS